MVSRETHRRVWVIVAIALTVRLMLLALGLQAHADGHRDGLTTPDSHDYLALARSMSENGSLPPSLTSVFRLPGYPAVLAGAIHLTHRPLWAVLQIAMDVALVWMVYGLGCELLGRRAALVGALLQ